MIKKMILGLAVLLVLGAASTARAQSTAELQAQIDALLAQLSSLQGGSSSTTGCYTFAMDLTIGSQNADVTALQNFLAAKGFFSVAATGYFGPITQTALAAWQSANGVAPAAGYFGPISRAKYNSMCSTSVPGDDTSDDDDSDSDFGGSDEGYLDEFDSISKYSGEEVGEDEEDAPVLGVEFEAADADQMIERVIVRFDTPAGSSPDDDLDEYIQDVSLWLNDEEIGRMDVDEASKVSSTDTYTFRFVNMEGILDEGDMGELVVAVTGVNNLDSGTAGDGWTVTIPADGIRASSPNGVVDEYDTSAYATTFTLETFAAATGVTLKIQESSDNPDDGIVNVDATSDTDDVELMRFTIEAKDGDLSIEEIPISFTTVGGDNLGAVASNFILEIDGDEFTESASTTATTASTVFDNLDLEIEEGDEVEVIVKADINDIAAGTFDEGDNLVAVLDASNRAGIVAEDETGEDLANGDKTGTATGGTMTFFDVGIMVTLVDTDTAVTSGTSANDDVGTFTLVYKVEAFDGTVFVSASAAPTTATTFTTVSDATGGTLYHITLGGSATVEDVSDLVTFSTSDGAADATNDIELADGESTEITLTVSRTNDDVGDAGIYQVLLKAIGWDTDTADAKAYTYTFDLDDFKTSPISLN